MNRHRMTSLVGALALLLGCAPLTLVFSGLVEWLAPTTVAVAGVVGVSIAVRSWRPYAVLQVAGMFTTLLLLSTWMFPSGGELAGVIPTPDTLANFQRLIAAAGEDIQRLALPVEPTDGLVFLVFLGLGSLAVLGEVYISLLRIPSLLGTCMLVVYLIPALVVPDGIPWLLFIPGALGYLWLLLTDNIDRVRQYGRRFGANGRDLDRWEPSPLATTGRWMAIVIIPLAIALPSVLPTMNTGLLDAWINDSTGGNGTGGNRVNPWAELEGSLGTRETTELGVVETDNDDPGYMKMWSASLLSEKGFEADTRQSEQAADVTTGIPNTPVPDEVETTESTAMFRATGLQDQALPLFGDVTTIDVDDNWSYDPIADTITSTTASTEDMTFRYSYRSDYPTPDQLRTVTEPERSTPEYRINTSTPDSALVSDTVDDITAGTDNVYDKTRAIFDYFSRDNGFSYELSTDEADSSNPVESFLKNKRGFCQQYAAAMAWMVREADVPARVAIGLTTGEPTGEGYRVTNFDFHAWVEVYFDDFGWVEFDPTPSSGVDNSSEFDWAPDPNSDSNSGGEGQGDDPQQRPDEDSEDSDSDNGGSDSDNGGSDSDSEDSASTVVWTGREPPTVWPYFVGGALAVAALIVTPALTRMLRRRGRLAAPADSVTATSQAWEEFSDSLRDLRIPVSDSETPRALAGRVVSQAHLDPAAAAGVWHLALAAEHSRYAPHAPRGLELDRASRLARLGIAERQSAWTRLRADVLPATTLSAWRGALSRAAAAAGHATIRARLMTGRLVRRAFRRRSGA